MDRYERFLARVDEILAQGMESFVEGGPEDLKRLVAYIMDWVNESDQNNAEELDKGDFKRPNF